MLRNQMIKAVRAIALGGGSRPFAQQSRRVGGDGSKSSSPD